MKKSVLAIVGPVAAALLAMVVVALVVRVGATSKEVGSAFTSTPQFLFWLLVFGLQAAVWVVAFPYVGRTVSRRARNLRSSGVLDTRSLAALAAVALLLIAVAAGFTVGSSTNLGHDLFGVFRDIPTGKGWPLPGQRWRVGPLVAVAFVVGVLAVFGIWLAALGLVEMPRNTSGGGLGRFVELRNEINTLLAIAALIIGLGTLATGLLREAVLATNHIPLHNAPKSICQKHPPKGTICYRRITDDPKTKNFHEGYKTNLKFDPMYVALYGLFLTVLLAVAFTPSYLALRTTGDDLRDRTFPLPAATDRRFDEIKSKREDFEASLQTNLSALPSVKAGVAILSPFILSLIPLLFGLPK